MPENMKGITIRFEPGAVEAAEAIREALGLEDRARVLRYAAYYGLRAFLDDVTLVPKAAKISIEAPAKGSLKLKQK